MVKKDKTSLMKAKKARTARISTLLIAFFALIAIVFFVYSVFAVDRQVATTSGANYSVLQNIGYIYNISINITSMNSTYNITEVNITIPLNFNLNLVGYDYSNNNTRASFANGSAITLLRYSNSSRNISWSEVNSSVTGVEGFLTINLTGRNFTYFWFNATANTSGHYNISVTTLEKTGIVEKTEIAVNVNDTIAPGVTIDYPAARNYSTTNISLNISTNENSTCWVSLDSGLNNNSMTINSTSTGFSYTNTSIAEKTYTANFYCNDTNSDPTIGAGNWNRTESVVFGIDTTIPAVTVAYPNARNYSTTNISFNVSLNENSSCWVSLDSGLNNNSMTTNASGTGASLTNTSIVNGAYTLNFYCNDTAGNWNRTTSRIFGLDTIRPTINLTYPLNTTYNYSVNRLNYTVSDTTQESCWYSYDNGLNNYTITCGANVTVNAANLSEGSNTWRIWANDSANNINQSNVTFVRDTISPDVNITYPRNISYNINVSILNYTVSTEAQSCRFSSNNGLTNQTITCGVNMSGVNSTQGSNTWRIYVNDSANNLNESNVTFVVDTISPNVNLTYPLNTTYNYSVNRLNYTVSDTTQESCWYSYDNGLNNYTITCGANVTVNAANLSEGSNTWRIWANDSANNINQSNVTFVRDTTPPIVTVISPTARNYSVNISFNISTNENSTCNYSLNGGGGNITMTRNATDTGFNASNWTMAEGTYNITFYCKDSTGDYASGNWNINQSVIFGIDHTLPQVTIDYPAANISYSTTNISINITLNENSSCKVSFDLGVGNYTMTTNASGTGANYTNTSIAYAETEDSNDFYNITIYCNDTAGNLNRTVSRFFGIDSTFPLLTAGAQGTADNVNLSQNFTFFAVNTTEARFRNITFSLYSLSNANVTSSVNITAFTATQNRTINWTNLADGNYSYNATVFDTADNKGNTSRRTLILDTTAPDVTAVNPVTAGNYSGTVVLNVTMSDRVGVQIVIFNLSNVNTTGGRQNATFNTTQIGSYWVNISFNTSHFLDGRYNITIQANDSLGNMNRTTVISNITIDNTAPVVTPVSPTNGANISTSTGSITIYYNVSDVTSKTKNCTLMVDSVNDTTQTAVQGSITESSTGNSFTKTFTSTGTHTWQINCSDHARNVGNTSLRSFTVSLPTVEVSTGSSGGGSGGAGTAVWAVTYSPSTEQLEKGYTKEIAVKERVKISISGETQAHYAGISSIDTTAKKVTINVSSTVQQATLGIGDVKKFEVTNDKFYDIYVKLNSITGSKANLTIKNIHEEMPAVTQPAEEENVTEGEEGAGEGAAEGEGVGEEVAAAKWWLWVIVAVVVIVIIILLAKSKKRKW